MWLLSLCQPQLAKTSASLNLNQLLLHLTGTLHGLDNLPICHPAYLFYLLLHFVALFLMVYLKSLYLRDFRQIGSYYQPDSCASLHSGSLELFYLYVLNN